MIIIAIIAVQKAVHKNCEYYTIDTIDYVNGIGNCSREQYRSRIKFLIFRRTESVVISRHSRYCFVDVLLIYIHLVCTIATTLGINEVIAVCMHV